MANADFSAGWAGAGSIGQASGYGGNIEHIASDARYMR
jgi:hypothetical protein